MRLAVVADIHGNARALRAVVADLSRQAPDLVVNLGDCLSGPLEAGETADLLMDLGWPTVRGNHDRWLVEQKPDQMGASDAHAAGEMTARHRGWIAALPAQLAPADGVLAFHATPGDDNRYLSEEVTATGVIASDEASIAARLGATRAPLMLFAHSHVARVIRLHDGTLLVNPGSVGLQAYEDETPLPHIMAAGTPHARYALLDLTASGWSVTQRAIPYDWDGASSLAARRGRHDWAEALATGKLARL